jgi:hypothetical protein
MGGEQVYIYVFGVNGYRCFGWADRFFLNQQLYLGLSVVDDGDIVSAVAIKVGNP